MRSVKLAAAVVALGYVMPVAASAQEVVGSYVAFIGEDDLYNSQGARLTQPWQVLRQDRANYHRYGISQEGDQWDPLFGDADNRAAMEQMVMNGGVSRQAARILQSGNSYVYVEILGSNGIGRSVQVEVFEQ